VLKVEFAEHASHYFRSQDSIRNCESCIVPSDDHLRNFSTREAFGLRCNALYYLLVDALHPDQSFPTIQAPWVLPMESSFLLESLRWLTVFDQIVEQHDSPLVLIRKIEADHLVDTIVDSFIKLVWVVGG
jgi:hypothetical protein